MAELQKTSPALRAGLLERTLYEWKTLALLGGPILVAQLAQMANGVVDTVMAGRVGAEDLAGVGIGSSLWVPLYLLFVGVLSALQPIISGHTGAGSTERVIPVTWQGIYIGAASALIMIALLTNVRPVLNLLRMDEHSAGISQGYLIGIAWGAPAMLLMAALRGLTDGLGHTRVIMAFSLLSTMINVPLNYVLIYGKLGLPAMGGIGCGWATAVSSWCAALATLAYLHWNPNYRQYHLLQGWIPPRWGAIRQVLKLGLPIGFTVFVEVSLFSVIALFLAPLGPVVVAGHQIVLNVVSLLFMLPLSLGMALTLRISFLLGAADPLNARLLARSSLLLALSIAAVYAPLLLAFRNHIVQLYTHDLHVQHIAAQLLMFAAIFQIADVLQVAAISALRGYRDTRVPMLIILLSFWVISLPLGFALTFTDLLGQARGASGFWIALIAGLGCASVMMTLRLFYLTNKIGKSA